MLRGPWQYLLSTQPMNKIFVFFIIEIKSLHIAQNYFFKKGLVLGLGIDSLNVDV